MKRIKRLLLVSGVAAIAGYSFLLGYNVGENKTLQRYVDRNLPAIINSEVKGVNIGFGGLPIPNVAYVVRDLPIYHGEPSNILGAYIPDSETMILFSDSIISPEHNLENLITGLLRRGEMGDATFTIKHEVGHHIANFIAQKFGVGIWPRIESYSHDRSWYAPNVEDVNFSNRLVSEGIGTYFERKGKNEKLDFNNWEWQEILRKGNRSIEEQTRAHHIFYEGGYALVKPIIDKFESIGILYLIRNTQTIEDLRDAKKYQDEALKNLAANIYFTRKSK